MDETTKPHSTSLAQTLAIQTQIHLPGTVGRLLKQIRELEQIAPLFVKAKLVRSVPRAKLLNVKVAGIATHHTDKTVAGGLLYISAGSRIDLSVDQNVVSTRDQDSVSEIDDIDFEDKSKRYQLIGMQQAYDLADRALQSGEHFDLILLDCPLLLNRSMEAPQQLSRYANYRRLYTETIKKIEEFWDKHRGAVYPWKQDGPKIAAIVSDRFGAIIHVSQQDLRTEEGRRHVLCTDELDQESLDLLSGARTSIAGIGERRFIRGILGNFTRTVAFRMSTQTPEMEPRALIGEGVVGWHYAAAPGTDPCLVQVIGDESAWTSSVCDELTGVLMSLTVLSGPYSLPLPMQLAQHELRALKPFLEHYQAGVRRSMQTKEIEGIWLSNLDQFQ
jgi:hypothetical protein